MSFRTLSRESEKSENDNVLVEEFFSDRSYELGSWAADLSRTVDLSRTTPPMSRSVSPSFSIHPTAIEDTLPLGNPLPLSPLFEIEKSPIPAPTAVVSPGSLVVEGNNVDDDKKQILEGQDTNSFPLPALDRSSLLLDIANSRNPNVQKLACLLRVGNIQFCLVKIRSFDMCFFVFSFYMHEQFIPILIALPSQVAAWLKTFFCVWVKPGLFPSTMLPWKEILCFSELNSCKENGEQ